MGQGARVSSIDAIRRFRAELCTFIEEASVALGEAQSDVQRTVWWLQQEQVRYWQLAIRKRMEKVAQAKSELYRAHLQHEGRESFCIAERKLVARAQAALQEARTKLQRSRHWAQTLDREQMLFRGQCQQLAGALAGDLPRAVAKMEHMIDRLQSYVELAPPPSTAEAAVDAGSEAEASPSMARPAGQASEHRRLRALTPTAEARGALSNTGPPVPPEEDRLAEPAEPDVLRRLGEEGVFVSLGDTITVQSGCLHDRRIYLERTEAARSGDSGWYVGAVPDGASPDRAANDASPPDCESITVAALLNDRPAVRDVLALPPGWLVLFAGDEIKAALNHRDEDVWNAVT